MVGKHHMRLLSTEDVLIIHLLLLAQICKREFKSTIGEFDMLNFALSEEINFYGFEETWNYYAKKTNAMLFELEESGNFDVKLDKLKYVEKPDGNK